MTMLTGERRVLADRLWRNQHAREMFEQDTGHTSVFLQWFPEVYEEDFRTWAAGYLRGLYLPKPTGPNPFESENSET